MTNTPQLIPKIVHQLWKDEQIPTKWKNAVASVKQMHPDWEYRLWTDVSMDQYVREKHPSFYPIFASYKRQIMRVDVFRYILMQDIGGVYCDMDYEFIRKFPYEQNSIVLGKEFDVDEGDDITQVCNFIFASVPGHPFWTYLLQDLQNNPNNTDSYSQVVGITGPEFITRILFQHPELLAEINILPRRAFNPLRLHHRLERKILRNSGQSYGLHIGSGSWKDRTEWVYWKRKLGF